MNMGGSSSKTQADSDDTHSFETSECVSSESACVFDEDPPMFTLPAKVENAKNATCHIMLSNGRQGSGSLVDGTEFGFPRTCILTSQHVLEDVSAACSAIARFNYEHEDGTGRPKDAFEVELDPELGFISHKDEKGLDFCLVACSDDPMTRD